MIFLCFTYPRNTKFVCVWNNFNIFSFTFLKIFFCLRGIGFYIITQWSPAAHQDHCGRCRIRTRDICPRSLVRYQRATTSPARIRYALYFSTGTQFFRVPRSRIPVQNLHFRVPAFLYNAKNARTQNQERAPISAFNVCIIDILHFLSCLFSHLFCIIIEHILCSVRTAEFFYITMMYCILYRVYCV